LVEIDVCLIANGEFVVGEAKINNQLAATRTERNKKAAALVQFSNLLGANKILLATSCAAWDEKSVTAVTNASAAHEIQIVEMHNVLAGSGKQTAPPDQEDDWPDD
jgi:hypothetical protein